MNKKRKYFLRRIFAPVLILAVCISCFAVTAFASDYENIDGFVNLADYNDFSQRFLFDDTNNYTCSFNLPSRCFPSYFEFSVFSYIPDLSTAYITIGGVQYQLEWVRIGTHNIRFFCQCFNAIGGSVEVTLKRTSGSQVGIMVQSMYVSMNRSNYFPDVGCMVVLPSDHQSDWVYMSSSSSPLDIYLDNSYSNGTSDWNTYNWPFFASIGIPYWDKFDFVDVSFKVNSSGIESVSAKFNGVYIMDRLSFIDSSVPAINEENGSGGDINTIESWQWVVCRLDLRGLDRSLDAIPVLDITGSYYGTDSKVQLTSVTGIISLDSFDEDWFWWDKVTDFFTDLFGGSSEQQQIIDNATQSQTQLNQTVNVEIENAVTDWNANVNIVSGGANNAIAASQVPLAWLSSLADRIFNNMGWFGNIYFTCGFLAVFMLILSKSGIAGRVKSSFGSSNPRSTNGGSKGNNTSS